MEKKTLNYLNSKIWYRFLKVLFCLAFLIILGVYNLFLFSYGTTQVDQNKTTIYCNLREPTETKTPFSPASIGVYLSSSDFTNGQFNYKNYFESYNSFAIESIIKRCYPKTSSTADIYDVQKEAEIVNQLGLVNSEGVVLQSQDATQSQLDAYKTDYANYQKETNSLFGTEKAQYLDFSYQLFNITPVFTSKSFWEFFLIGNFVILLIFEVLRRVFYYVVLGSVRPEK